MHFRLLMLTYFVFLGTSLAADTDALKAVAHVTTAEKPLVAWQQHSAQLASDQERELFNHQILTYFQTIPPQDSFLPLLEALKTQPAIATRTDDDHGHLVEVYAIGARAAGLQNDWLGQQVSREALWLLQQEPIKLADLAEFSNNPHPAVQSGLRSALQQLNNKQQNKLIEQLLITSDTTRFLNLKSTAGIMLHSQDLLSQVINAVAPAESALILKQLSKQAPNNAAEALLFKAAQTAGSNQKLALTLLTPYSQHQAINQWLTNQLGNPDLGRAAAFTLAANLSVKQAQQLSKELPHTADPVLQKNILFALSRNAEGLRQLAQLNTLKLSQFDPQTQRWLAQILGAAHD